MKKYRCFLLLVVFLASCQKLKDYLPKPEPKPLPQFNMVYGGSQDESADAIIRTKDDGYLFTGSTGSTDGDLSGKEAGYDAWVVKLNKSGGIQWQETLGGSSTEHMLAACQTKNEGYIIAGYTYSNDRDVSGKHGGDYTTDAWVVKLDGNGTLEWQKALGGSDSEIANAITASEDGGYVVAGLTLSNDGDVSGSHGNREAWIVKLDDGGNIQWQKTLGGSHDDEAYGIAATSDGGYVVAAGTGSSDGDVENNHEGYQDAWILKLDRLGNIVWDTTLGGSQLDAILAVTITREGHYLIAGITESNDGDITSNHGDRDAWVLKFDQEGKLLWQKTFGGSSSDGANSIVATADGGFAIAGYTTSNDGDVSGYHGGYTAAWNTDVWVVRVDKTGSIRWQKALGGTDVDYAEAITKTKEPGFAMTGFTQSHDGDISGSHGETEAWVVTFEDQ